LAIRLWDGVGRPHDYEGVVRYIQNQEEHHKRVTFEDEFRRFLDENGIDYDERYMWD